MRARVRTSRRGHGTTGLLATLAVIGALGAVALFVAPRHLAAGSDPAAPSASLRPEQRALLERLAELAGHSAAVLAVHPREGRPFAEILLWLEDGAGAGAGAVDPEELGLLSHSTLLQTLIFTSLDRGAEPGAAQWSRLPAGARPGPRPGPPRWTPAQLEDPRFCDRWRAFPFVESRVLARGLSDARFELREDEAGTRRLQVSLTWVDQTADRPDTASVLVDLQGAETVRE